MLSISTQLHNQPDSSLLPLFPGAQSPPKSHHRHKPNQTPPSRPSIVVPTIHRGPDSPSPFQKIYSHSKPCQSIPLTVPSRPSLDSPCPCSLKSLLFLSFFFSLFTSFPLSDPWYLHSSLLKTRFTTLLFCPPCSLGGRKTSRPLPHHHPFSSPPATSNNSVISKTAALYLTSCSFMPRA